MWAVLPKLEPNPFLDATAGGMLADLALRFAVREAIVAADRRITYADFAREAERMARGLLAAGVGKNDKVALWLPNRPAWLFVQYACAMIGAVLVALNTRYKAHELAYILAQSDATTLILADHLGPVDFLETLGEVLPDLRDGEPGELDLAGFHLLKRVIVDAEDPYPGCLRLRDVLDAGGEPVWQAALERARVKVTADDPWTILYTSGTTSFPKGALISHRNAVPHGWYAGKVLGVTETDRVLHALPLTGTWGGLCIPLSTFAHGGCLVLMETFDPAVALHLIEREGITMWNAVDAMAIAVLDHPDLARRKRSTLRTGGFGMTGGGRDGLFEDIVHMLGVPQAYQPYGMTELNALCLLHYLDESEASRISHFMVAPAEIEAFIMTHPQVSQAFVIGVPDPKLNEAPVAFVIPRDGEPLTEAEVIAHCKGKIASFKVPRHVRIVADVPRTPGPHGDKVQKAKLRELFLAEGPGRSS